MGLEIRIVDGESEDLRNWPIWLAKFSFMVFCMSGEQDLWMVFWEIAGDRRQRWRRKEDGEWEEERIR